MKNLKTLTICLVFALALTGFGQTTRFEKPLPVKEALEQRLPGNAGEDFSTVDTFHLSLGSAGISGGSARVLGCDGDHFKQVGTPMNKTLRQALDTMVETDSRYRWQVADQVINLLPVTGEPSLLQTQVKEFRAKDISSARDALPLLLALPEVKKAMGDLGLKQGLAIFVSSGSVNPKPFSVVCENVTLRQVLNAIAYAQGRVVWDYVETHCDGRNEVIIRF